MNTAERLTIAAILGNLGNSEINLSTFTASQFAATEEATEAARIIRIAIGRIVRIDRRGEMAKMTNRAAKIVATMPA